MAYPATGGSGLRADALSIIMKLGLSVVEPCAFELASVPILKHINCCKTGRLTSMLRRSRFNAFELDPDSYTYVVRREVIRPGGGTAIAVANQLAWSQP